ncbi:hypothetical protein RRG08_058832 [Elysia crispata]|uniref:Uncharacterized protein n=1 Tax=Elysia crispata TaxID=231223 RepID=A0AAE1CPW2_9GAST|nr:hypothetical protein RRG08_058832 [Elysia crispata]
MMKLLQTYVSLSIINVIYLLTLANECSSDKMMARPKGIFWVGLKPKPTIVSEWIDELDKDSSRLWSLELIGPSGSGECVPIYSMIEWKNGRLSCSQVQPFFCEFPPDQMMARHRGIFWIGFKFNYAKQVFKLMDELDKEYFSSWSPELIGPSVAGECVPIYSMIEWKNERLSCSQVQPLFCEFPPVCMDQASGKRCTKSCSPYCGDVKKTCDIKNEACDLVCVTGYQGDVCDGACEKNTYGPSCLECSPYCGGVNKSCDRMTGSCVHGCIDGYQGERCSSACEKNTYGPSCLECSPYCGGVNKSCDRMTGSCVHGCIDGYQGERCSSVCEEKTYGPNCSKNCSPYCGGVNKSCDRMTGSCVHGCIDGYQGERCSSAKEAKGLPKGFIYSETAIISAILFIFVVLSACVAMAPINEMKRAHLAISRSKLQRSSRSNSGMERERLFYTADIYS